MDPVPWSQSTSCSRKLLPAGWVPLGQLVGFQGYTLIGPMDPDLVTAVQSTVIRSPGRLPDDGKGCNLPERFGDMLISWYQGMVQQRTKGSWFLQLASYSAGFRRKTDQLVRPTGNLAPVIRKLLPVPLPAVIEINPAASFLLTGLAGSN